MVEVLATLLLFVWAASAFTALPESPDFSKIPIWHPKHPILVILALILGVVGFYVRYHFPDPNEIDNWFFAFLVDLAPEMVGMAFTVVVIDELNQRHIERQDKEKLIMQMGSPNGTIAREATRELRLKGWLTDGSLENANLWLAELSNTDLRLANLKGAALGSANLENARLSGANLKCADFAGEHSGGIPLSRIDPDYPEMTDFLARRGANLKYAKLTESILVQAKLGGANLQEADLSKAILDEANLNITDFSRARLVDTSLRKTFAVGAKFESADIAGAVFDGANLHLANLCDAQMRKVSLQHTNLSLANLIGADLRGANLEGANLTHAYLTGVKYSSTTKWPNNFDPDCVGAVRLAMDD